MRELILLIDDDPDELTIFAAAVTAAGLPYKCIGADSAMQGLEWLKKNTPAYIFVDINMPQINGLACVSMLRKMPRLDKIPIIVYSTGVNEAVCKSAIALGAASCIKKESGIDRQAVTIARVLSKSA